MRIGIDCRMYSINFTGIGRYVYELIQNLAENNDPKITYILFLNPTEYKDFVPPAPNFHKVRVDAPHYTYREQWHFYRILQNKNLDLMHFTHFNAPILYNRPFIVTIHDLTLSFYPGKKMNKWYHRLAYHFVITHSVKKAKHIISVSQNTKKDLQKLFNLSEKRISVIYEGVNKEFFEKKLDKEKDLILEKHNIRRPFLLYTGVWRDHKNLIGLIKSFSILKKKYNVQAQLVITGKENPYYPEVKQTTQKLDLAKDVIFTGMVPEKELVTLYQSAKIYTFPSFYEGFGLSLLEAMSCELPIAASNAASIPEVCGKNNAVLFNPRNIEDMASKIYELYSKPKLQEKLKQNGLKRVKDFSWKRMSKQTLAIYQNLLTKLANQNV